jgi:hypothetical protein
MESRCCRSLNWQMSCVCLAEVLFVVVKWQSMYRVHIIQIPLPRRRVSAGTLVRNYGATNMEPTQKDKPLLPSKRRPHFQTYKRSWSENKLGHVSRREPKPRTIVPERTSSKLLDWTARLPESWDRKIWPWILQDCAGEASSNFHDRQPVFHGDAEGLVFNAQMRFESSLAFVIVRVRSNNLNPVMKRHFIELHADPML